MVLDLGLPDGHGLTLLQELRAERPYFPVLVHTAALRPEIANRADTLRAQYCCKPALENVARFALESAAGGTSAVTACVGTFADQHELSPAARAVLLSCVVEEPTDEFLTRRDIAESTYRSQLKAIKKKMGQSASTLATNLRQRILRR